MMVGIRFANGSEPSTSRSEPGFRRECSASSRATWAITRASALACGKRGWRSDRGIGSTSAKMANPSSSCWSEVRNRHSAGDIRRAQESGATTLRGRDMARRSEDWNIGLARDLQDPKFAREFLLGAVEEGCSCSGGAREGDSGDGCEGIRREGADGEPERAARDQSAAQPDARHARSAPATVQAAADACATRVVEGTARGLNWRGPAHILGDVPRGGQVTAGGKMRRRRQGVRAQSGAQPGCLLGLGSRKC